MAMAKGLLALGAMSAWFALGLPLAYADGSADAAAAQVLYDRATELMDNNRWSEACPKLEEVTRLVPDGLGARLTLAECYEREGKLASAWAQYSSTAEAAARTGQVARHERAAQKALSLWPNLATITVNVSPAAARIEGFTLRRDGSAVSPAQWGERIPVDAGTHVVDIEIPGKDPKRKEIRIDRDGVAASMTIDSDGNEQGEAVHSSRGWQKPLGFTVGGVGLAALGVGFALGGVALAKSSAAGRQCDATLVCSQEGLDLRKQGKGFANAATALIAIGAVGTAAGIVLVVSAPKAHRTELAMSPGALFVRGQF